MRILSISLLFAMSFLVTACSSSTSIWDSMPYQEAIEWQGMGVQYKSANQLRNNGFAPLDARPWYQAGVRTSMQILDWYRAGFTPLEASKWQSKAINVTQAIEYRKKGLTVE